MALGDKAGLKQQAAEDCFVDHRMLHSWTPNPSLKGDVSTLHNCSPTLSTRAIWFSLSSPQSTMLTLILEWSMCREHFPCPFHLANSFTFFRSHPLFRTLISLIRCKLPSAFIPCFNTLRDSRDDTGIVCAVSSALSNVPRAE